MCFTVSRISPPLRSRADPALWCHSTRRCSLWGNRAYTAIGEQYEPHEPTLWFNLFNQYVGHKFSAMDRGKRFFPLHHIWLGRRGNSLCQSLRAGGRPARCFCPAGTASRTPAGRHTAAARGAVRAMRCCFALRIRSGGHGGPPCVHWNRTGNFTKPIFFSRPLCSGRCRDAIFPVSRTLVHSHCLLHAAETKQGSPWGFHKKWRVPAGHAPFCQSIIFPASFPCRQGSGKGTCRSRLNNPPEQPSAAAAAEPERENKQHRQAPQADTNPPHSSPHPLSSPFLPRPGSRGQLLFFRAR